jgi:hypothetical protein
MTSCFYVVSIVFHTSVPALRKCMHTSRKKLFWLRVQPLVHRLLHLFVRPERLASHRLFEQSKDMKFTGGWGLASTADVQDTQRTDLGLLQKLNGQYGAEHCHGAKHLYSDVHVVWTWLQDAGDSLGDLDTLYWSQCSPWACSAPKIAPRISQKRVIITFPADGCVRNFFGFGEEVWHHSSLALLVSAGGSGPRFHLP